MRVMLVWVAVAVSLAGCRKAVESVEATPENVLLTSRGQVASLAVQTRGKDGQPVPADVSYSAKDAAVASVDAAGKVTAHKSGETIVTAKAGEHQDQVSVQVRIPARIEVEPDAVSIQGLGGTAKFEAKVLDELDRPIPGAVVNWTVDEPRLASIVNGTVTAMQVGSSGVTVSFGPVAEVARIEVTLPAFETVVLEPSRVSLTPGEHELLMASVKNAAGQRVAGVPITFESSDPSVATVNQAGRITAVAPGRAKVTALAGSHDASVAVLVRR